MRPALVSCDGAHSKASKLAGIDFDGTFFAEQFLLAAVRLDWNRSRQEAAPATAEKGSLSTLPARSTPA